mmetsp:Transcript_27830/g.88397  ORF Transcript_27830/g.88397 Transcript_27830/m.88397 type:complete len:477 (+) Transcript_27830:1249-2679(+)
MCDQSHTAGGRLAGWRRPHHWTTTRASPSSITRAGGGSGRPALGLALTNYVRVALRLRLLLLADARERQDGRHDGLDEGQRPGDAAHERQERQKDPGQGEHAEHRARVALAHDVPRLADHVLGEGLVLAEGAQERVLLLPAVVEEVFVDVLALILLEVHVHALLRAAGEEAVELADVRVLRAAEAEFPVGHLAVEAVVGDGDVVDAGVLLLAVLERGRHGVHAGAEARGARRYEVLKGRPAVLLVVDVALGLRALVQRGALGENEHVRGEAVLAEAPELRLERAPVLAPVAREEDVLEEGHAPAVEGHVGEVALEQDLERAQRREAELVRQQRRRRAAAGGRIRGRKEVQEEPHHEAVEVDLVVRHDDGAERVRAHVEVEVARDAHLVHGDVRHAAADPRRLRERAHELAVAPPAHQRPQRHVQERARRAHRHGAQPHDREAHRPRELLLQRPIVHETHGAKGGPTPPLPSSPLVL